MELLKTKVHFINGLSFQSISVSFFPQKHTNTRAKINKNEWAGEQIISHFSSSSSLSLLSTATHSSSRFHSSRFTTPSCAFATVSKSIAWEVSFKGTHKTTKLLFHHTFLSLSFAPRSPDSLPPPIRDEMNLKCSTFSVWLQVKKKKKMKALSLVDIVVVATGVVASSSSTWYYCRSKANNRFLLIHSTANSDYMLAGWLYVCSLILSLSPLTFHRR